MKAIGLCAFGACKNLFKLVLPENVERLDAQVFAQCTNLSTMVSLNTTPPTVKIDKSAKGYEDTFMQFDKKSCTLKVPAEAVEAYKAAEGWSEFKIVALTEEEKIALSLSSPIANTGLNGKAFNLQGVEVGDSYRGIVIKGGKKIVRK